MTKKIFMAIKTFNNIKLGAFVLTSLLILILLLYMIGRNRNLFGSNYTLKATFENIQGLKAGNNVRFAGIDVGTVKKIEIKNDTLVEITMIIDKKVKNIIRKNAIVSIGTDGLVGNKVVNIIAAKKIGELAKEGDFLPSKKPLDTDDMLKILQKTNADASVVAENLKYTTMHINQSNIIWSILNDTLLYKNLRNSIVNIHQITENANKTVSDIKSVVVNIKNGKGTLGAIITDTVISSNLNKAINKIYNVGKSTDTLVIKLNQITSKINYQINNGNNIIHSIFQDSIIPLRVNQSLENIENASNGLNQNMEALKHSFLFRHYFKKKEKKKLSRIENK